MRTTRSLALLLAPLLAGGCGVAADDRGGGGAPPPDLPACLGTPFTPAPVQGWRHPVTSPLTVALGPAGHSMQDVLATPGGGATIQGKFAYGAVSKDLEDEAVRVVLDACHGWISLGDVLTDADGRIALPVPATLGAGIYDVRLQVLGDGSVAAGRLWLLPAGTHLAVTDIDGTLTTSDEELVRDVITDLFQPIFSGQDVPSAWPGAAALSGALTGRGLVLVYLTGRPYWLTAKTRQWLADGGFAAGPLHLAGSNAEAIPSEGGVGAFKRAWLQGLLAQGFVIDEAYGNATTDVSAYAGAGIPAAATWIIGPNGGADGTVAVVGSWEARAAAVAGLPPVMQPFQGP
jgi:hypothetical protein